MPLPTNISTGFSDKTIGYSALFAKRSMRWILKNLSQICKKKSIVSSNWKTFSKNFVSTNFLAYFQRIFLALKNLQVVQCIGCAGALNLFCYKRIWGQKYRGAQWASDLRNWLCAAGVCYHRWVAPSETCTSWTWTPFLRSLRCSDLSGSAKWAALCWSLYPTLCSENSPSFSTILANTLVRIRSCCKWFWKIWQLDFENRRGLSVNHLQCMARWGEHSCIETDVFFKLEFLRNL